MLKVTLLNFIKNQIQPYTLFKKVAFSLDPELIHEGSMALLEKAPFLASIFSSSLDSNYEVPLANQLTWKFPVGLAAGLDKNAQAIDFFSRLNFGAVEVGTVTPLSQPGNDKPRLFRYPEEESLRNRMGFNNVGMEEMYSNILKSPRRIPIGINIGKNKLTPNSDAYKDYQKCYAKLAPLSDYMVVNVSSPNTPGLRDLQAMDSMREILQSLKNEREKMDKPLFLKISPDMSKEDIQELVKLAMEEKLQGVIATNTTTRPDLGPGGISGKLLSEKSREARNWALEATEGSSDFDIIGVGGISSFEDLVQFWKKGGKVVQIYTSFIYQGPTILSEIKREIDRLLRTHKINDVPTLIKEIQSKHMKV